MINLLAFRVLVATIIQLGLAARPALDDAPWRGRAHRPRPRHAGSLSWRSFSSIHRRNSATGI